MDSDNLNNQSEDSIISKKHEHLVAGEEYVVLDMQQTRELIHEVPWGIDKVILVGERLWVCDEAIGTAVDGKVVSFATIVPEDNPGKQKPGIEAVYTFPEYRLQGYGLKTLRSAIERCKERGFDTATVEVINAGSKAMTEKLTDEEKAYLEIHDLSNPSFI